MIIGALGWRHPAFWPKLAQCSLGLAVFTAPLLAAWLVYLRPAGAMLQHAKQEELQLQAHYRDKLLQAATVPALHARQQLLERHIEQHQQQFSDSDNLSGLLGDIATMAEHHQLTLEQATPGMPIPGNDYLALPLQVRLRGRYHDFGHFAAALAAAPRTLVLSDMQMTGSDEDHDLLLQAAILSYRRRNRDGHP